MLSENHEKALQQILEEHCEKMLRKPLVKFQYKPLENVGEFLAKSLEKLQEKCLKKICGNTCLIIFV